MRPCEHPIRFAISACVNPLLARIAMSFVTTLLRRILSSSRVATCGSSVISRTISTTLLYVFLLIGNDLSAFCNEFAARRDILLLSVPGFIADRDDVKDLRFGFRVGVKSGFFQRPSGAALVDGHHTHWFDVDKAETDLGRSRAFIQCFEKPVEIVVDILKFPPRAFLAFLDSLDEFVAGLDLPHLIIPFWNKQSSSMEPRFFFNRGNAPNDI